MADSDDDAPPPLSSLADQVDAIKLRSQGDYPAAQQNDAPSETTLHVANVVVKLSKNSTAPARPLRKGFFDAAPKKQTKPAAAPKKAEPPIEEIPLIRAKKGLGSGPVIPDFLRVEPDEQEKRFAAYKADLVKKLQPTPDTMAKIAQDPTLLAGFDDPEVMTAVNDIAANPQNMKKYKDKPKVMAFYAAMGTVLGEKLESLGQSPSGPYPQQRPL